MALSGKKGNLLIVKQKIPYWIRKLKLYFFQMFKLLEVSKPLVWSCVLYGPFIIVAVNIAAVVVVVPGGIFWKNLQ